MKTGGHQSFHCLDKLAASVAASQGKLLLGAHGYDFINNPH